MAGCDVGTYISACRNFKRDIRLELNLGGVFSRTEIAVRRPSLRVRQEVRIYRAIYRAPRLLRSKIGQFQRAVVVAAEGRSRELALVVVDSPCRFAMNYLLVSCICRECLPGKEWLKQFRVALNRCTSQIK